MALASSVNMSGAAGGTELPALRVLGELLVLLLAGLALLGSELEGVGWRRMAEMLDCFEAACGRSGPEARGGEAECVRGGVRPRVTDMAGRGPWGLRALVAASRGSIMTAWAAWFWRC